MSQPRATKKQPTITLGFDWGASNLRVGTGRNGVLLERTIVKAHPDYSSNDALTAQIVRLATRSLARAKVDWCSVSAVGNATQGQPNAAGNIAGGSNCKLRVMTYPTTLARRFGIPVFNYNDVSAGLPGRYVAKGGKVALIGIMVGTGLNAGYISADGTLFRTQKTAKAAKGRVIQVESFPEAGHLAIPGLPPVRCGCGSYDCAEVGISGSGFVRQAIYYLTDANSAAPGRNTTALYRMLRIRRGTPGLSRILWKMQRENAFVGEHVVKAAKKGDKFCRYILHGHTTPDGKVIHLGAVHHLAQFIRAVSNAYPVPTEVFFWGGIAANYERLVRDAVSLLVRSDGSKHGLGNRNYAKLFPGKPVVIKDDLIGLRGAIYLAATTKR